MSAQTAALGDLIAATYIVLGATRATIERPLATAPDNEACKKLKRDYATYPWTFLGLAEYLRAQKQMAVYNFFRDVVQQIADCARPSETVAMKIIADAGSIDCLLRPEWFPLRASIYIAKDQVGEMVDHVLLGHKVESRPFMVDRATADKMRASLRRGLLALHGAVSLAQKSGGTNGRMATKEITDKFARFPSEEPKDLKEALEGLSYDEIALTLCHVMDTLAWSTKGQYAKRVIYRGLPVLCPGGKRYNPKERLCTADRFATLHLPAEDQQMRECGHIDVDAARHSGSGSTRAEEAGDRPSSPLSHESRSGVQSSDQMTEPNNTTTPLSNTTSRSRAATYPPDANNDDDDAADVLNELLGGSYARGRLSVSRFEGPSAFWSAVSWAGQGMSINPAREVEEDLRNRDFVSEADEMSLRSGGGGSEHEMDLADGAREKMDSSLPANDGMDELRQQLQQIKKLAISTEEKAMKMHHLMVQDYVARNGTAGNVSPMSLDEGKHLSEEPAALDVGLAALPIDPSNPYNVRPGDLEPSFSPLRSNPPPQDDTDENIEEDDFIVLGCMHYKRNVKVQCFDCHRWFPCRYCHDQSHDLPFPHSLRRKMTRNMMCMLCQTPQPAAETCEKCGEYAAYYFCPKCKLWDNDSNKRIYHCDECGICRLGEGLGKDFVHCRKCDVCISISTSAAHTCVENATKGACPLCLDEMFASRAKVVSLPCGHYMHAECYKDLMAVTYKCPVCSKSAVNMELQWRKIDDEIRAQPMPEDDEELGGLLPHIVDHAAPMETPHETNGPNDTDTTHHPPTPRRPRNVWIGCNDCNNRCTTPFHWLGLKCQHCDSYNTNQMAPTAGHVESETERLMRQQQIPHEAELTGNAVLRDAGIGAEDGRVDSALEIPGSPASYLAVPASPGSPGTPSSNGLPSPRRYFVRDDDEPRRPSFTTPRFSAPTLPTLPNLPEMPRLPRMPNLPNMPNMPNLPNMDDYWPNMPELGLPNLPNMPEFGKFSGLMFDSLSRSLSPMRYYLQGLDVAGVGAGGLGGVGPSAQGLSTAGLSAGLPAGLPGWRERGRVRRTSRLSVRSDPTADASGAWSDGSDGVAVEDEDDDDEDEGSGSESEDAEMIDDGDDDVDAAEDVMELFGHR